MASVGEHLCTYHRAINRDMGKTLAWFLRVLEVLEIGRKLLHVVFQEQRVAVLERFV